MGPTSRSSGGAWSVRVARQASPAAWSVPAQANPTTSSGSVPMAHPGGGVRAVTMLVISSGRSSVQAARACSARSQCGRV
ncbi:hypothetical protein ACFFX0_22420 [Citricoccus parietis]|uniref:Uncharacterized protein n=1 Tax=Citricoccus parietis TaxID=592307 RepID=A0ABV5G4F9_9MICC